MCDHPHLPGLSWSRRAFLRRCVVVALAGLVLPRRTGAQSASASAIAWARLVTPGPHWAVHRDQDDVIAQFIRNRTGIAMDPKARVVEPASVEALAGVPLIFSNDLARVVDPGHQANIREYIRRGGFFFVDACVDARVTPSFPDYFRSHTEFFQRLFPGVQLRMLLENHAIFRSFFHLDEADTRTGRSDRGHWGNLAAGLYGVYDGDQMISLLSLDRLRCGWANDPERMAACVKLIANVYVYAMTR
jgi:hypothetical protein